MRRRKSQKEKMAISKGVKTFWDKKGRKKAALALGSVVAGGGALALAAKKGKLRASPKGPSKSTLQNISSAATVAASPQRKYGLTSEGFNRAQKAVMTGGKSNNLFDLRDVAKANLVDLQTPKSTAIVPYRTNGSSLTVGRKSPFINLDTKIGRVGGRAFAALKMTPGQIVEGYQTAGPGDKVFDTVYNATRSLRAAGARLKKAAKRGRSN